MMFWHSIFVMSQYDLNQHLQQFLTVFNKKNPCSFYLSYISFIFLFFRTAGSWLRTCGDWQEMFRSLRSRKVWCWKKGSGQWKAGIRWSHDVFIDYNEIWIHTPHHNGSNIAFLCVSLCWTEILPAWKGHPYICQDWDWCKSHPHAFFKAYVE